MLKDYTIECAQCSGLCCTALYFSKIDGFPEDKVAEKPCSHLKRDFLCDMHADLADKGMRGCIGYDCFGAGQYVTQEVYRGETWQSSPAQKASIFKAFHLAFTLFQIGYYLECARESELSKPFWQTLELLLAEHQTMLHRLPNNLTSDDVESFRIKVNETLKVVCGSVVKHYQAPRLKSRDFFGKSFKNRDFSGQDLCMTLLIAADFKGCTFQGTLFLGADTRDANFESADLSKALFLTQAQVNVAKGNDKTQLPKHLTVPMSWIKR